MTADPAALRGSAQTAAFNLNRNGEFLRLWAGEAVSLAGSEVSELALPLTAVVVLGAGPGELGLLGAARFLPFLLITLPAGVWVDRVRRLPVLVWSNLGRAILIGLVPVLALAGMLELWHLVAISFAAGLLAVLFDTAYYAYLPSIVDRSQLTDANARLTATANVAAIGGPGLGGTLVQVLGGPLAMGVDAASFLVSAASLGSIRRREPAPARRASGASIWGDLREGFAVTFGRRALRSLASTAAAYNLFGQWFSILFLLYAVSVLHLAPAVLGVVLGAGAAGALVGSVTAGRIGQALGVGPAVVWAVALEAMVLVPVALVGDGSLVSLVVLAAINALNGFGLMVSSVHAISIRQGITPDHLLGRMTGSYRFLSYGAIPIGAVLGGLVGELVGIRWALLIGAIGTLTSVLFVLPLRSMHTLEQAAR